MAGNANVENNDDPNVEDPNADGNTPVVDDDSQDDDSNQPPVAPVPDETDLTPRTPRERAMLNKARADEKAKLYKNQTELRETVKQLQTRLNTLERTPRSQSSNEPPPDATNQELLNTVRQLQERIDNQDRKSKVERYRDQVIANLRRRNIPFVEYILNEGGDTEEEIDIRADVAQAEAEVLIAQHGGGNAPLDDDEPPVRPTRRTVTRNGAQTRPNGVPPMPTRHSRSGESDNDDGSMSLKQISHIVRSGAGVRSGNYAQNREKILAALHSGKITQ